MTEKPFLPAKSHFNSVAVLKGALASIIADPDCCAASKAIARNAMRQIRDAKADNASDMEQSQVYRDAPEQVNTEHTPGPWRIETPMHEMLSIIEDDNKEVEDWRFIADCSFPDPDDPNPIIRRKVYANARLIAASPTMIDALIKAQPIVCKATCVGDDHSAECLHITATIAEATNA